MLDAALAEAVKNPMPADRVTDRILEALTLPEVIVLHWFRACQREWQQPGANGAYLRQLGLVPELYWRVAGPFPFRVPESTEVAVLQSAFGGMSLGGSAIQWQAINDVLDGYIDCATHFQTADRVSAYAMLDIACPQDRGLCCLLFHDDEIRMWLNDEPFYELGYSEYSTFELPLRAGQNHLLVRVTNWREGWGFLLRLSDQNGQPVTDLDFTPA